MAHYCFTLIVSLLLLSSGPALAVTLDPVVRLLSSDGSDPFFGLDSAIDGTTAIIGGDSEGAVLVDLSSTIPVTSTLPTPPNPDGGAFGASVAIDGQRALVSTVGSFDPVTFERNSIGFVTLFDLSTPSPTAVATLMASDGEIGDQFGRSLALDGDTALIGADGAGPGNGGAAYVFDLSGTTPTKTAILTPPANGSAGDFGADVALDGQLAVVGADEIRSPDGNSQAALFDLSTAPPTRFPPLGPDTVSSNSPVATEAGIAVFGSANDSSGAFTVIDTTVDPGDPGFDRRIAPMIPDGDQFFVEAVAISDGVILVGGSGFGRDAGAAFIFDAITGAELGRIDAPNGATEENFGYQVSLSGNLALISALGRRTADGPGPGVVYVYDISNITAPVPLPPSALLVLGATGTLMVARRWTLRPEATPPLMTGRLGLGVHAADVLK
ncbi:MAG: FG-GAP repeat protein [Pseudomonadota bacterium]